jgi:type I restriction enzyme S subunit
MSEWRAMTIAELAAAGRYSVVGGPFGSALGRRDYSPDGVPVIRGAQLGGPGAFSHDDLVFVSEEKADRHAGNLAYPGDVVVTQRGTVGQIGRIPPDGAFSRYLLSQSQMKVTVDSRIADSRFLYYALLSPDVQQNIHASTMSAGVPHINLATFRSLRVSVPSLDTQRRVAAILGTIDDLAENYRQQIALLDTMAREIYREWFVRFRYPGDGHAFVDSPLGPIPRGWQAVRLAELVSTQYGYTESAQWDPVGPRYLRGMDINKTSYVDWNTVPYCPIVDRERKKYHILPGDIFIIRMADPGKVGICEVDLDAVFASYLVRLRPTDERITPYFLFFTLLEEAYQSWVTGASTGATRKSVSARVMTEPFVVVPEYGVQAQFDSVVRPLRLLLNRLVEGGSTLTFIRDLLLPGLVTGQIDVSGLDLSGVVGRVA